MRSRPAVLSLFSSLALVAAATSGAVAASPPDATAKPEQAAPAATDTDGDSLPDTWETNGYDANGDGVIDVDLPKLGASPRKKDLFVEMDYMPGLLTTTNGLDRIVQVFATAPVSNPDGTTGINIHLDAGAAGGAKYNLGGGNQVPFDANLQPSGSQTEAIKAAHFNPRRAAVFHYMIWASHYDGGCSSGQAFAIPNDTFIVTLGNTSCSWAGSEDQEVGTFVHELGHNLGLRHGGTDHGNYKPNYLSVMNYHFQLGGVIRSNGTLYWGYSNVAPAALNEANLNESTGLGAAGSAWRTKWRCPGTGTTRTTAGAANLPIDWNCDGDSTDVGAFDINFDNARTSLTAQNNWASVVFGGGDVGQGTEPHSKTATSPDDLKEMTAEEYHSHR